jgi:SecD/SecF fusion protein
LKSFYRNTLYLVLALLAVCIAVNFYPDLSRQFPLKKGLDLAGGTRAVLLLEPKPGSPPITSDTQQQVVDVMTKRINAFGVKEPLIQKKGADQILIEMPQTPGTSLEQQRQELEDLIAPANLEFIWLKDCKSGYGAEAAGNPTGQYEYLGGNQIRDVVSGKMLTPEEIKSKILYADRANTIVTGAELKPGGARVDLATGPGGGVETTLEFNDEGAKRFASFTRDNIGALLAIVLNGEITSAPRIQSEIPDGKGRITQGNAQVKQAQELANLLNSGALPVPLRELQSSTVKATLGESAVGHAVRGGVIGIALVILFMLIVYFVPGAVATVALIFYAAITFTLFRLLGVTLTLPGIAGFILSIGMAVDANILIFERMKEEMRAGRTLHAAVDAGFDRAWTSIRDSNIATLITCFVLFTFGTGPIKGFAVVLALGVLVSLFTAVTVSRALLHGVVNQEWAHNPALFKVGAITAPQARWNVMGRSKVWWTISALLIVLGWSFNGLHLQRYGTLVSKGIDFTGGAMLTYALPSSVKASDTDIQQTFAGAGIPEAIVQRTVEPGAAGKDREVVNVRTKVITEVQRKAADSAMKAKFADPSTKAAVEALGFEAVGPVISKELTWQAVKAIFVAAFLIMLYLGYAFGQHGFKDGLYYGAAATASLLHDVMFIFGFMGFAGYFLHWEMSSLFVTAALTIIGFTNHDTIVVFDRIRENMKIHGKELKFNDIADLAIMQTFHRSMYTSFTVILTLAALLFFGTAGSLDLKVFTSILLVGVICGTYSSIFFATPVLAVIERKRDVARLAAANRKVTGGDTRSFVTPKPQAPAASAPRATDQTASSDDTGFAARSKAPGVPKKTKRRF